MSAEGLAAAVVGAKRPSQVITWTDEDGAPLDLSGATITARIVNTTTGTAADSDGQFVITDGPGGEFRWDYGSQDVATQGMYQVQFTAAFGTAPTPARTIKASWLIHGSI